MNILYFNNKFNFNSLCFFLSCFLLTSSAFAGKVFYVYKDMQGNTHMEGSIPGELTKHGYKIVNAEGITLRIVPSVETKVKTAIADEARTKAEHQKNIEREKNKRLLRRFTSLEDIRDTGNKKILALQKQIDLTKGYILAFENNLNELEDQAIILNEQLKNIPENDVPSMERLKVNIEQNKVFIDQRKTEQRRIRDEFIVLIKKYKKLTAAENNR